MGLIPHFSFQRFNRTGGLAFHQGVKCLIFLLVSFFFLHNECKSENVNKAFAHHTQALLPPPASHPCSDLRPPSGRCSTPLQVTGPAPAAPPPSSLCPGPLHGRGRGFGKGMRGERLGKATAQKTLPSTAFTSVAALTSTSAITSATITSTPGRAARARRTQLSRPLQGAAQRPRFLCTLERVINLK